MRRATGFPQTKRYLGSLLINRDYTHRGPSRPSPRSTSVIACLQQFCWLVRCARRKIIRMRCLPLAVLVYCAVLCGLATAQMSTLPAAKAIADLPGPPKTPPIFSQMTVILQGSLQFENTVDVKGPVAEVQRQDAQLRGENPNAYHTSTTLKFDDQERLIKRIFEDSLGTSTLANVFRDGRLQSQTVDYHSTTHGDWQEWQQWTYDDHGQLSDFRAGRDRAEWNHYLNFKYDAQGRPLGYEYLDSKIGGTPVFTEVFYSGKTVTLSRFGDNRHKFFEQVQMIDDQNRVIDLKVSDLSGVELKQWYHVEFKYDAKGRVTEQNTDPFKLGDGDDYSPIPGKLVVQYDDETYWGEQKFYDPGAKLGFHARFQFDRDGIPTKFVIFDSSGKEMSGSETFVDAKYVSSTRPGSVEWEVIYDDHGNWTERRRWFTPADGSPRIMTRLIRQTLTYR
jgi:hypothetical protein